MTPGRAGRSACPSPLLDGPTFAALADLFRHLSDPRRLDLLMHLARREHSVGDLAACLGVTPSAVSHQLATLRRAHLIDSRREGQRVYYHLADEHVARLVALGVEHVRE